MGTRIHLVACGLLGLSLVTGCKTVEEKPPPPPPAAAVKAPPPVLIIGNAPTVRMAYLPFNGGPNEVSGALTRAREEIAANGWPVEGSPTLVFPNPGQVVLGFELSAPANLSPPWEMKQLPPVRIASLTVRGAYETCWQHHDRFLELVNEKGLAVAGPVMERLLDDPKEVDEAKLRCEIMVPVSE